MTHLTHLPEPEYLQRLGTVAYLVAALEGLLMFDLPRLSSVLPAPLAAEALAGLTTHTIGRRLIDEGVGASDPAVAAYLVRGGELLQELAPLRNAVLHARPATDNEGRTRLYRWRLPNAFWISDEYLGDAATRIEGGQIELNNLRPGLDTYPPA